MIVGNCQAGWQIMMMAAIRPELMRPDPARRFAALLLGGRARAQPDALSRRHAGRHVADGDGRRSRQRHLRRRQSRGQFRILNPANTYWEKPYGLYAKVDTEAPRFLDFETLVGQPGPAQRLRDAVDRRQPLCRQQAHLGRDPYVRRRARRPAQHPLAHHRAVLVGRQHHAAATGAGLDHRSLRARGRDRRATARPSSTRCIRRSATSASSSRARWRPRSMPSSPRAWR